MVSLGKTISAFETRFDERVQAARAAALAVDNEVLLATELDQLVDILVAQHAAGLIAPIWESFAVSTREVPYETTDSHDPPALQITTELEVEGAANALRGVSTSGHGTGASSHDSASRGRWWIQLVMTFDSSADPSRFEEYITDFRNQWFAAISEACEKARPEIEANRADVRAAIESVLSPRFARYRALHAATQQLGVPLNQTDGARSVRIPVVPRALTMARVEKFTEGGGDAYGLDGDIADALIEQIASFANALERLPVTADRLLGADEESLRDVLLFILNANWDGQVTGETFVGEGKTDIRMGWKGREAFIGECKIWEGSARFSEAIDQLLDRYTVWRATRVALIVFIRDRKEIGAVIDKAWDAVRTHDRFVSPGGGAPRGLRSAHMSAQLDRTQLVQLALVPVVIPRAGG